MGCRSVTGKNRCQPARVLRCGIGREPGHGLLERTTGVQQLDRFHHLPDGRGAQLPQPDLRDDRRGAGGAEIRIDLPVGGRKGDPAARDACKIVVPPGLQFLLHFGGAIESATHCLLSEEFMVRRFFEHGAKPARDAENGIPRNGESPAAEMVDHLAGPPYLPARPRAECHRGRERIAVPGRLPPPNPEWWRGDGNVPEGHAHGLGEAPGSPGRRIGDLVAKEVVQELDLPDRLFPAAHRGFHPFTESSGGEFTVHRAPPF